VTKGSLLGATALKYEVGHQAEYIGLVAEPRRNIDERRAIVEGLHVIELSLEVNGLE
jgi:hypothetical protein